jgi:hypothetical protein
MLKIVENIGYFCSSYAHSENMARVLDLNNHLRHVRIFRFNLGDAPRERCPQVLYAILHRLDTYGSVPLRTMPRSFVTSEARALFTQEDVECPTCSICLASSPDGGTTTLPCGHAFHGVCVNKWFENQSTCPYCRDDVNLRVEVQ